MEEVLDIYDVPSDDPPPGAGAKRARVKGLADNFSGSRATNRENNTFNTAPTVDEDTIAVDTARSRDPRRAPEAPMLTRAPAFQQSSTRVRAEQAQSGSATHLSSTSGHNLPHINQGLTNLPLANAEARRDARVNGGLDVSTPSEDRRRPYALSGDSLSTSFSTDTALVKVSQPAVPSKPAKPQLHYIVPKSTGGFDHDNPLPRTEFVDSNLSDFFETIARRAGKPTGSFSSLTFMYNWGERETFVVDRYMGDQYWEEIKERVKGTFLISRASMPNMKVRFELWIKCVAEEEEDW